MGMQIGLWVLDCIARSEDVFADELFLNCPLERIDGISGVGSGGESEEITLRNRLCANARATNVAFDCMRGVVGVGPNKVGEE